MKNRKTVVVAFLLVAVMLMGVGYAALTDVLDITGTADVNQSAAEEAFNEDVYFSAAEAKNPTPAPEKPNTASVNADNKDKASFTANTLKGKDDEAEFTFTITNDGDVDATVTPKLNATLGNTLPEYFKVTSDWMTDAGESQSKTLAAHSSITYTITVELLKTPTETISGSFLIELTAVSAATQNP